MSARVRHTGLHHMLLNRRKAGTAGRRRPMCIVVLFSLFIVSSFTQVRSQVYSLSGNVFEDVNYGGGAGRSKASSSGTSRSSTRVELYTSAGVYSTFATTNASGNYVFSGLAAGTYYLRVVNSSVTSSRTGYTASCLAVQTYRTDASSGTASAVTDNVGGTDPSAGDPGNGSSGARFSTTTYVYSAGLTGTAQSVTKCVIGLANITGLDFGFNFNTIVNTNNSGQGSLRQFIANANTLGGDASLVQSGLVAGMDNAVFMIANGTAGPGLRSSNNYFIGGTATISPTSALPTVSTVMVIDAQQQPGWSSAPIVEINGTSAGASVTGLTITGGGSIVRGFIINRFLADGIDITTNGGNTIAGCYVGTNSAGTAASANSQIGIYINNVANNTIGGTAANSRNVVSGNAGRGISISNASATNNSVVGNYVGTNAAGSSAIPNGGGGIVIDVGATSNSIGGSSAAQRNVVSGNTYAGIRIGNAFNNTVKGNSIGTDGTGTASIANTAFGVVIDNNSDGNLVGGTGAGDGNFIAFNGSRGVVMANGIGACTGNGILSNSMYGNGGIGIDLDNNGVSVNDGAKNAGFSNVQMDYPVFTTAILNGTTLTLAGYVGSAPSQSTFAAARVEVFKSDNDASGYGEGRTYLGYLTADANGNFSGSLTVSGMTSGDKITGTATDGSNNTSEFGANVTTVEYLISGNVFEDVNYGGGAGRSKASSGGMSRSGARVELFDASGNFSRSTTTDGSGNYTFNGLSAATYYVRVVNDSVSSSRTGYSTSLKSVMTYRTNAATGTAVAVTDYVGGQNPSVADAPKAASGWTMNTTTGLLGGSGSGTAQSFSQVTLTSGGVTGVDFGFNFNTIVNTNDAGQGSLRQLITNANTLGGDASLAQSGLVAGRDNAVFMISNGTAGGGLRSSNNYFGGGVATISPTSALPVISTVMVLDAQKQPSWSGAPVIELNGGGAGSGARGLELAGGSTVVRGFVINRFTGTANSAGIWISGAGQDTIQGNYIGTNAAGSAASANYQGIYVNPNISSNVIGGPSTSQRNVMSGNIWRGLLLDAGSSGNKIQGNYVGLNAAGTAAVANQIGIYISQAPNNTVGGTGAGEGNVVSGNSFFGLYLVYPQASGNVVQGNTIGLNAARSAAVPNGSSGIEICCAGAGANNNTIGGTGAGAANVISGNTGSGILMRGGTGNAILANSIYGNGGIGIDLGADNVTSNNGTKNASLPNYDMDYPVFTSATLSGTALTVAGYVGSAANQSTFASARVEIFKSDNDATGYGEGQTYLGFLTADANGNISGSLTIAGLALGDRITGTATDASSNTSEFGPNFSVTGVKIVSTPAGGNWSVGSTWVGGVVPTADNPVDIVSGATVTLDGNITRNAADTLSVYGTLNSGTNVVSGAGPFTLAAGGTLGIGDPAGISASSSAGNIQVSGTRSFSTNASYGYNGSSAQSTGNGLPAIVNNLTVNNNAGVTLTGSATVNGALTLTNGALGIGANTLTLNGNVSAANGSLTSGATGTVIYNRSSDGQAVLAANYGNLTFSNFNKTLASSGTIGIAGTFTPGSAVAHTVTGSTIAFNGSGAQTIPAWSYNNVTLATGGTKTAGGNLALAGTLTIGSGVTLDAGSFTHTVQGDWSNSGTFVAGTSTIQMSGGSNAGISGTNNFNILTVNKSASSTTVTLNNSLTVATLNMTQGTMLTGSNSVTITGDRTGNGVIIGTITRTHSFVAGVAYAFESPFSTITFASGGTLPGSVTMTVVLSSPGANSSMEPIGRYYDLSQTGGSGFSYALRLHYEDAEVTAPNSETSPPLQLWRRISAGPDVWERKGATASNTASNWVEASGQTDLGRWTLSSRTVPNMVLTMAQSDAHPSPGQIVTYTITYNNNGDGPAGTVLITASAPTNTSYVPGNTALNGVFKTDQNGDDEVTVSGSTITINLGSVAAGASGTITYKVTIQ